MVKNILSLSLILTLTLFDGLFAQNAGTYSGVVSQTLELFEEYQVVALGENHGKLKDSEFRLSLIKHPEFSRLVDVIVVEFANPLFQDMIDDYTNGKDVPYDELVKVWRNTTQVNLVWSSPVYEQLFKTVREVNLNLPQKERIRIIAADPPVNWSEIETFDDFKSYGHRGSYPIGVIEREVYQKGKKALLIFGQSHVMSVGRGFTNELKHNHPNSLIVIFPPITSSNEFELVKPYLKRQDNHLIDLHNNKLGEIRFSEMYPFKDYPSNLNQSADFILYLGNEPNETLYAPEEVKNDSVYKEQRKRRMQVLVDG